MNAVIVTPSAADHSLAAQFIGEAGIATRACTTLGEAIPLVGPETGCFVIVEEALDEQSVDAMHAALVTQPPWSDLPLLLIAGEGSSLWSLVETLFPSSGKVTVLQRPIHPVSLVSAVKMSLRARLRQLQVRDLLAQRDKAVNHRDEFLAMLAHELRNPLTPIRSAAYMLGRLEIDDEVFLACREMVDRQVRHITRLVDDLLDVSRIELGKVDLRRETVDVDEIVTGAVQACSAAIEAHHHMFSVRLSHAKLTVIADPVRLEQVIENLVLNAVKFTPSGGSIEVDVTRDHEFAVISVADNGAGIQPGMLESIFDLFTQDSVTLARSKGGLGIGLTLVRRLVELHGGTVRAFSEGPGRGARFEVRLPLGVRLGEATMRRAPVVREASAKRVLVIEDGADTRKSLGLLLSTWKHDVVVASNGQEGLERARETRPDVAIIDIGLPGLDGYEVAQRIRGDDSAWSRQVKLIALTGYGQANDRARALDAGFDIHMLKPVDPAELRSLLA